MDLAQIAPIIQWLLENIIYLVFIFVYKICAILLTFKIDISQLQSDFKTLKRNCTVCPT